MPTETIQPLGRPRKIRDARLFKVWVPLELMEALDVLEVRTKRTKASHVRDAIEAYLDSVFLPKGVDENTRKVG